MDNTKITTLLVRSPPLEDITCYVTAGNTVGKKRF